MVLYNGAEVYELFTALSDKISEPVIKVTSVCIVRTGYQYLKTKVAFKLKE